MLREARGRMVIMTSRVEHIDGMAVSKERKQLRLRRIGMMVTTGTAAAKRCLEWRVGGN